MEEVTPPQAIDLSRGQGGEEVIPPPDIGPEWSAGKRECSHELLDPMSWPDGKKQPPCHLFEEDRQLVMRMNVFEIAAMLSVCLYQRFFNFVISFDCDTLITKSYFCPRPVMWDIF